MMIKTIVVDLSVLLLVASGGIIRDRRKKNQSLHPVFLASRKSMKEKRQAKKMKKIKSYTFFILSLCYTTSCYRRCKEESYLFFFLFTCVSRVWRLTEEIRIVKSSSARSPSRVVFAHTRETEQCAFLPRLLASQSPGKMRSEDNNA